MANRKSNRAARWLFGKRAKFSNRRRVCHYYRFTMWDDSGSWQIAGTEPFKPSRSQRRSKCYLDELRIERHFKQNHSDGMSAEQAWAEAVRTIKG